MTPFDQEHTVSLADRTLLVGHSSTFRELLATALQVARSDASVLITGERGVGKDLIARLIHERSPRSHKRFVPFNVSAVTETLFESDLFGQTRGAFTGAYADREGYLAEADGGTLFLDEIGALNMAAQAKLLRAVEHKTFRAIGGRMDRFSNFRLIAATNENLVERIRQGTFRADLRDRLNVISLRVPPLRDRRSDIGHLVEHFFRQFTSDYSIPEAVRRDVSSVFADFNWPGNIRQLRSAVHQLVIRTGHADHGTIVQAAVALVTQLEQDYVPPIERTISRADYERRRLLDMLEREAWKIDAVAANLQVDRRTVYRRMQRAGIRVRSASQEQASDTL